MTTLFNLTHDADNLSEYDSTETGGGDLSTGTPGLGGSNAKMEALINDTGAIWGTKNLSYSSRDLRFRFYINPNGLTMGGSDKFLCLEFRTAGSNSYFAKMGPITASEYDFEFAYRLDSGSYNSIFFSITDAEHRIEVYAERASGVAALDGSHTVWLDGVQQTQNTGLDIWDRGRPDTALLGATAQLDAGTSGTLYLDEFRANDDGTEIGPVSTRRVFITHT